MNIAGFHLSLHTYAKNGFRACFNSLDSITYHIILTRPVDNQSNKHSAFSQTSPISTI